MKKDNLTQGGKVGIMRLAGPTVVSWTRPSPPGFEGALFSFKSTEERYQEWETYSIEEVIELPELKAAVIARCPDAAHEIKRLGVAPET